MAPLCARSQGMRFRSRRQDLVLEVRFGSKGNAEAAKKLEKVGDRLEVLPDRILVYTENGEKTLEKVTKLGLNPVTSLVRRSSLEDVFLRLTGRTLVD